MSETLRAPESSDKERRWKETHALLSRYHAGRDPALRDELAERLLPFVHSLARRYAHHSEPMDDLIQVGSIGLLNAIDRYDPDSGTAFSSFAVPTILGEIKRHFRDRTWSVRVPRSLQELSARIQAAETDLERRLGRSPTAAELAAELGTDVEELLNARAAGAGRHTVSLDRTRDGDDADGQTIRDRLTVTEPGFRAAENSVAALTKGLSERTREILRLRFEEDLTQADIALEMGLSQMHVSRLIRTALAEMAGSPR
jgi:RNA polymerase sigma-B factor